MASDCPFIRQKKRKFDKESKSLSSTYKQLVYDYTHTQWNYWHIMRAVKQSTECIIIANESIIYNVNMF